MCAGVCLHAWANVRGICLCGCSINLPPPPPLPCPCPAGCESGRHVPCSEADQHTQPNIPRHWAPPPQPPPQQPGPPAPCDLAIWLVQRTALDLLLSPQTGSETDILDEPLPPPIWPGNLPPSHTICSFAEQLQQLYVGHNGSWAWVNEGTEIKKKYGYVSSTPGDVLRLKLNTTVYDTSHAAKAPVQILVVCLPRLL